MQKNSHVLEAHATVQRVQMQELSRSEDRVHVLFWKKTITQSTLFKVKFYNTIRLFQRTHTKPEKKL